MTTLATPRTADPAAVARHRPARWWPAVLPVAALAAGVAALGGATSRQLWYDEYTTWYAATELTWAQLWRLLENVDATHGGYYALMRLWTVVAGDSPIALRAPSIVGMAVAAAALCLLGRRFFGTAVGVTAGLIFAALPSVSRYGQETRPYALVTAGAALTTLTLLWTLRRPTWRRFLGYGACLLALLYLHVVAGLVLAAHAALVWAALRRADSRPRRLLWGWLATVALVLLGTAPLAYQAYRQVGPPWQVAWGDRPDAEATGQYPEALFGSTTVAWVVVPIAVLGVAVAWYARRGPILPLLLWAGLPPAVCYAIDPWVHVFVAKYALFTLPAWVLLAAVAIAVPFTGLRRWLPPADRTVVLGLAVLLIAAAGISGHRVVRLDPVYGEPDFRAAAAVIDQGYQPGDGIAFGGFSTSRAVRLPIRYELRNQPRDVFLDTPGARLGSYASTECVAPAACLGDTRRIWLVLGATPENPLAALPAERAALLGERFIITDHRRLKRVDVLLLTAR